MAKTNKKENKEIKELGDYIELINKDKDECFKVVYEYKDRGQNSHIEIHKCFSVEINKIEWKCKDLNLVYFISSDSSFLIYQRKQVKF